jgi:3-hydroxyacyl-CoA dehydrogenase
LSPLATIDLVGWDVHKAIVDNIYALSKDEAHEMFKLPQYMQDLIAHGHLGNKTPQHGGFFRRVKEANQTLSLVLDPKTGAYKDSRDAGVRKLPFVEKIRDLHRVGRYGEAMQQFVAAEGAEADLARKVIFGYVSYGLNRVGDNEVVRSASDVDRIMGFGFNWAPPTVLVDVIGLKETVKQLERYSLPVPAVLKKAEPGRPLFREPNVNVGRFFAA